MGMGGGEGTARGRATAHRADEGQRGNQNWIGKSARYAPWTGEAQGVEFYRRGSRTDLVKTDRGAGEFGPVETSRSIPGR